MSPFVVKASSCGVVDLRRERRQVGLPVHRDRLVGAEQDDVLEVRQRAAVAGDDAVDRADDVVGGLGRARVRVPGRVGGADRVLPSTGSTAAAHLRGDRAERGRVEQRVHPRLAVEAGEPLAVDQEQRLVLAGSEAGSVEGVASVGARPVFAGQVGSVGGGVTLTRST